MSIFAFSNIRRQVLKVCAPRALIRVYPYIHSRSGRKRLWQLWQAVLSCWKSLITRVIFTNAQVHPYSAGMKIATLLSGIALVINIAAGMNSLFMTVMRLKLQNSFAPWLLNSLTWMFAEACMATFFFLLYARQKN